MKIKIKSHQYVLVGIVVLWITWLAGPQVAYEAPDAKWPAFSFELATIEAVLKERESKVPNLKSDNEARIIWADSVRKTPYSIVYLHGFSASPMEAAPVHLDIAKKYGCNLVLPRLPQHGINSTEMLADLQPSELVEAAKEAIEIGLLTGDKVLVMGTSTGATLGIYLAAFHPEKIAGLILYAPNIDLQNPFSGLLTQPWGVPLARLVEGGNYHTFTPPPGGEQYWTTKYPVEGLAGLKALLNYTMTEAVFSKIQQPLFVGYYYKDEDHCDDIISIPAVQNFFEAVKTSPNQKEMITFPEAGTHAIPSGIYSKDVAGVSKATQSFLETVIGLKAVATIH